MSFEIVFAILASMGRWFLITLFLLFSHLHAQLAYRGAIHAKGAVLINAETGAILYEKNGHAPLFPSSTTKILTALYALEQKGGCLDDMVTASHDAVAYVSPQVRRAVNSAHPPYRLEYGGTHMNLKPGEILPFRALVYGLMLSSGNDAANVIAQYISGSIPQFVNEMNAYAARIGCTQTHFCAPHGLPHPEHKTTASDMALILARALKIPFFRDVIKTVQFIRPQSNLQAESVLNQHNALVKSGKFHYAKAIGGKTGYTTSGGFSLVAAAENGERKLIVSLLSCATSEERFQDAIALFEAAFNEKKVSRTLFSKGFDLFTRQVEGGSSSLQAQLEEEVVLRYFPSEEPIFQSVVEWDPLVLPIKAGDRVGKVRILSKEGRALLATDLFAVRDVDPTFAYRIGMILVWVKRELSPFVPLILALIGGAVLFGGFSFSCRVKRRT